MHLHLYIIKPAYEYYYFFNVIFVVFPLLRKYFVTSLIESWGGTRISQRTKIFKWHDYQLLLTITLPIIVTNMDM